MKQDMETTSEPTERKARGTARQIANKKAHACLDTIRKLEKLMIATNAPIALLQKTQLLLAMAASWQDCLYAHAVSNQWTATKSRLRWKPTIDSLVKLRPESLAWYPGAEQEEGFRIEKIAMQGRAKMALLYDTSGVSKFWAKTSHLVPVTAGQ